MEAALKQLQHNLRQKQQQIAANLKQLSSLRGEEEELITAIRAIAQVGGIQVHIAPYNEQQEHTDAAPATQKSWYEQTQEEESTADIPKQNISEIEITPPKQKKWYVIFNGPMKGIYNDWGIAASHITGKKGIDHKSFPSKNEADAAFYERNKAEAESKEKWKQIVLTPAEEVKNKKKMVSLGRVPSLKERMRNIPTAQQVLSRQEPTVNRFTEIWNMIVEFKDIDTTKGFYPKKKGICPKAVFVDGCNPDLVFDAFIHGMVDAIYTYSVEIFSKFPLKQKHIFKNYLQFADVRETYAKIWSSYPVFNSLNEEEELLLVPTISLVHLGISDQNYPYRDEYTSKDLTVDVLINSLTGLFFKLRALRNAPKVRLLYASKQTLIYSTNKTAITSEEAKKFVDMERQFYDFSGLLEKLPEEFKQRICEIIRFDENHMCHHCCKKESSGEEENA